MLKLESRIEFVLFSPKCEMNKRDSVIMKIDIFHFMGKVLCLNGMRMSSLLEKSLLYFLLFLCPVIYANEPRYNKQCRGARLHRYI